MISGDDRQRAVGPVYFDPFLAGPASDLNSLNNVGKGAPSVGLSRPGAHQTNDLLL